MIKLRKVNLEESEKTPIYVEKDIISPVILLIRTYIHSMHVSQLIGLENMFISMKLYIRLLFSIKKSD